jgi:hypothetical protein
VKHVIFYLAIMGMFSVSVVVDPAWSQGIPFSALTGDELQTTFSVETIGGSLHTEASNERVRQMRGELFLPLHRGERQSYGIHLRASRLLLDEAKTTSAGPSGTVPRDLGAAAVGPYARFRFASGDMLTIDAQVGRSGIRLGSGETATTVAANLIWARNQEIKEGRWIYLLSYSNSRSSLNGIPLPGFAYAKAVERESVKGFWAVGAPFFFVMLRGQPFSFSTLLTPFTSFVETGYSFVGPFGAFLRFGWQPQGFKLNGGPAERLLYEEFRTQLGLRGPISRKMLATLGVSYSDGRRLVWGESLTKATSYESRLGAETALFFNLAGRF